MSTSPLLDALYLTGLAFLSPWHAWRLLADRAHRAGLRERWGNLPAQPPDDRRIWLHCSSVGEALVARRLVPALESRLSGWSVALSTSTDTGYNTAVRHFAPRVVFRHLPTRPRALGGL